MNSGQHLSFEPHMSLFLHPVICQGDEVPPAPKYTLNCFHTLIVNWQKTERIILKRQIT